MTSDHDENEAGIIDEATASSEDDALTEDDDFIDVGGTTATGVSAGSYTRRAVLAGVAGGVLGVTALQRGADWLVGSPYRNGNLGNVAVAQTSCEPTPEPTSTPEPTPTPTPTPPPPPPARVRRDLHSLAPNGPELQTFAQGVAVMRQRPAGNPTSWAFQANMHPTNCQHNTIHFVSWHRMYIYYFERILRDASGDPTFTLPFWNYAPTNQRILPAPFRDPANPLYIANRSFTVRTGQQPGPDQNYRFDHQPAFAATNFTHTGNGTSFGGRVGARGLLESAPHNTVHTWIGGVMATLDQAPLDPIFWSHHSNLDRLWGDWLNLGGGRANPGSGIFLDTNFTFYDVGGNAVVMRGSEILDTVGQLGYTYEGQGSLSGQSRRGPARPGAGRPVKFQDIGTSRSRGVRLGNRPTTLQVTVRGVGNGPRARRARPRRASLTLRGVAGGGVPGVGYEVHVNAASARPSPQARSFVGPIGLFGLPPNDRPGHGPHTADISFDITRALGRTGVTRNVKVTIVPADFTGSGELPGGTWATVEQVVVSVAAAAGNGQPKRTNRKRRARPANRQRVSQQRAKQRTRQRRNKQQPAAPKQRRPNQSRRRPAATPKRKGADATNKRTQAPDGVTASTVPGNKLSSVNLDPIAGGEAVDGGHAQH